MINASRFTEHWTKESVHIVIQKVTKHIYNFEKWSPSGAEFYRELHMYESPFELSWVEFVKIFGLSSIQFVGKLLTVNESLSGFL